MGYKQPLLGAAVLMYAVGALALAQLGTECSSGFSPADSFHITNGLLYLAPERMSSNGHQVIVPQMKFNCHGIITGWSALTVLPLTDLLSLQNLPFRIVFQVWRPTSNENDGQYTLVGSNMIQTFLQHDRIIQVDNTTVFFELGFDQGEIRDSDERIIFQPGDVAGWFSEAAFGTTTPPLNVIFRNATNDDDPSLIVDMHSSFATGTFCETSICGDGVNHHFSVVPYVSVQYSRVDEPTGQSSTPNPNRTCQSTSINPCTPPTRTATLQPTNTPTTPTQQPPTGPGSSETTLVLPLIIGISLLALLLIMIVIVGMILLCCVYKRRNRHNRQQTKKFNENPTYATPDIPQALYSAEDMGLDYETSNGALYALPHGNRSYSLDSQAVLLSPDIFDGECYASTYRGTNGQMHVYQELEKSLPDYKGGSVPTRRSFRSARSSLPRFSASSISNFPYTMPSTMPNTPAPSYPYLEAIGSRPRPPAIPLPQTPEETPPSSASMASSGPPVRKLFIGLDDDGFHVPSADERLQFPDTNVEEVYSRLNRAHPRSRNSRDMTFFEQSDFYWEPPSSTNELYNQLAQRKYREIQRNKIRVTECIGEGHFGTVHKGVWEVPGAKVEVAVKTLKPDSSEEDRVMFLREAAIMGQFLHPNVVKLQGVVTVGEPLMIVLELMPRGDLKHYLREFRDGSTPISPNLPSIFIDFCRQIAFGMNYLSNKAFLHRDLATRNILLTEDLICKIGDFGMARDLAEDNVYHSQGGKIPIKWTAPEALNYRKFSTASDVWSYGMVLFEIWSLGRKPYERISTAKMMELVNSGHCQSPPPGCPRAIYQLMVQCWHFVPAKRLKFSEICDYLNSSDDLLLNWSSVDRTVSERVMELGAPLSEARNLYPDLQYTYDAS